MRLRTLPAREYAAPAAEGDCIGSRCPCRVLEERLTMMQRACVVVMVLGLLGFVAGMAEYLHVF